MNNAGTDFGHHLIAFVGKSVTSSLENKTTKFREGQVEIFRVFFMI